MPAPGRFRPATGLPPAASGRLIAHSWRASFRAGQGGSVRPDRGGHSMTAFRHACLIGLAVATCAGIGGAQAAVSRSGVISKFDGVDESAETCTSVKHDADMSKMSLTFATSGAGSALVTFSGSASLAGTKFDT